MNYGELKTAVQDWSHRPDLSAQIPTFIQMAHSRIVNDLNVTSEKEYATLAAATNVAGAVYKTPLPADCLRVEGVTANGKYIQQVPPAVLARRYQTGNSGEAANYAIYGDDLWVAPGDAEIAVWYYKRMAELSADADTNLVLTRYPQVYIYASLVHLHEYVQDSEMVSESVALYDAASEMANRQMMDKAFGAAPVVVAG